LLISTPSAVYETLTTDVDVRLRTICLRFGRPEPLYELEDRLRVGLI
jgi:hypothetical protein